MNTTMASFSIKEKQIGMRSLCAACMPLTISQRGSCGCSISMFLPTSTHHITGKKCGKCLFLTNIVLMLFLSCWKRATCAIKESHSTCNSLHITIKPLLTLDPHVYVACHHILSPPYIFHSLISMIRLLHSDRQAITDVPAIYFVTPNKDNVRRICEVCQNIHIFYHTI